MPIETLADWNAILGQCCCEMPSCPTPTKECESATAVMGSAGWFDSADVAWTIYDTKNDFSASTTSGGTGGVTVSGSAIESYLTIYSSTFYGAVNGTSCFEWESSISYECETSGIRTFSARDGEELLNESVTIRTQTGSGGPGAGCTWTDTTTNTDYGTDPPTVVVNENFNVALTSMYADVGYGSTTVLTGGTLYENPQTHAEWLAAVVAAVAADAGFVDGCKAALCVSSTVGAAPELGEHASATVTNVRYRWQIPDTWEGSYFKVTWDILEEPDGWDAEAPEVTRSFFAEDLTYTWTGPGDPEDPDTWLSGWYELPPPTTAGTRRIVNVRYECYRSTRFGQKPQVTGEAVELPDP